jgi:predicted heme/steroid binding protein
MKRLTLAIVFLLLLFYSSAGATAIPVHQGDDLQTAINNAQPGDTLVLDAGAQFTGPITLPNKGNTTAYITSDGRVYGEENSLFYASGAPNSADYDVEADIVAAQTPANRAGIAGRITPAGDHYRVSYSIGNGQYELQRVVGGTMTLLQSASWNGMLDGGRDTVKLQMRGNSIKVFVDGVERMSVIDSDISEAGHAGISTGIYSNTSTWGLHIDNFSATNAP